MWRFESFNFQNVPDRADGGLVINAEVRVIERDGEPWFVAKDVISILGVGNITDALTRLNSADFDSIEVENSRGAMVMTKVVNESGLYDLILDSRKPQAKAFRKWVTSEVLPTIRKTGGSEPVTATAWNALRSRTSTRRRSWPVGSLSAMSKRSRRGRQ